MTADNAPVAIVTGATSGIGRWIALGLARAGFHVVVVARDHQRGQQAASWITAQLPAAQVEPIHANLESLRETQAAGLALLQRYPSINLLMNNAGVFLTHREETPEGHERVLTVNHLAPFLLTRTLLPALTKAAATPTGARIINTGSSTADRASIDPSDLEGHRRWGMVRAYSQSKLALTMTTLGWARQLLDTGVVANVVHPGTVATSLVRAAGPVGLAWRIMAPFLLSEEQGADTPLHVAVAPAFKSTTGAYVKRRRAVPPNPAVQDPGLMAEVWAATERLVHG